MKKGQKVRILRTNQVATIVEVELIRKSGKVHRYCHLKVDKKPDLWLDSSELGGLVERCRITFHDDRGQELYFDVEALAAGEFGRDICLGSGNVTCSTGEKVECVIRPFGLD